jgi:hypothetical protein
MNIKQERFIYARLKDYEQRLKVLEKLVTVRSGQEAPPEAGRHGGSLDHPGCQTEASQSLEARSTLTTEPVTR